MARTRQDSMDSKTQATLCTSCGGWPAPVRPRFGIAYCEVCAKFKKNK